MTDPGVAEEVSVRYRELFDVSTRKKSEDPRTSRISDLSVSPPRAASSSRLVTLALHCAIRPRPRGQPPGISRYRHVRPASLARPS